jgi:hypothetical protein
VARVLRLDIRIAFVLFAVLDLFCVGLGMGVPAFCILLGFPTGWYIAKRAIKIEQVPRRVLPRILAHAVITAAFTFVIMAILWGRCVVLLFDPDFDLARFGHPMILFTPKASFIGWLVLMILLSPLLQLLTTISAAYLGLVKGLNRASACAIYRS